MAKSAYYCCGKICDVFLGNEGEDNEYVNLTFDCHRSNPVIIHCSAKDYGDIIFDVKHVGKESMLGLVCRVYLESYRNSECGGSHIEYIPCKPDMETFVEVLNPTEDDYCLNVDGICHDEK